MFLSHRIRLYLNNSQKTYFRRAFGIRRMAYNWALVTSRELYEAGEQTSGYDLAKKFNSIKHEEYPWVVEVSKWASQKAIYDAWESLNNWWKGLAEAPRFKKKGKSKDSFYFGGVGSFRVEGKRLKVPKLGWIRMYQELRLKGIPKSVTISRHGDRWYASILVELDSPYEYPHFCETQTIVGIDLGIKTFLTLSDGSKIENPRWLLRKEKKLKRLQKALSRKKKGSNNRNKAVLRLVEAHRKISDARSDYLHKISTSLVKTFRYIGIEDLHVQALTKNNWLAKQILDVSWYQFRRQLEYKSVLSSSKIVVADRWFPSSKTCSMCGFVNEKLILADRVWTCAQCGSEHDRDINAAKNIRLVAQRYWETQNACGGRNKSLVEAHSNEARIEQSTNYIPGSKS